MCAPEKSSLQKIMRLSLDVICTIDATGRFQSISDASLPVWGYAPEELVDRLYIDLVDPDDHAITLQAAQNIMTGQNMLHFENHYRHKDGRRVPMLWSARWDPEEQLIYCVARDASALKAAEQALQNSALRYEYITRATFDAVWDWDLSTDQVIWGLGIETVFGHPLDSLAPDSSSWTRLIHPEDHDRVFNSIQSVLQGTHNNWSSDYRLRRGDGSYADVQDKGIVMRDAQGQPLRMVGAVRDISQEKKEVQRLKLLESVIVHSKEAVLITEAEPQEDPGPRIVYVNQAFTDITGYTEAEVLGKSPRLLQGPQTDRRELDRLKAALKAWQPCEVELLNYTRSGTAFWVHLSISPVADEKGWFTHWISVQRDITTRKHQEQQRELLAYISQVFGEQKSLAESLTLILGRVLAVAHLDVAEIWLANPQRDRLFLAAAVGADAAGQAFVEHTRQLPGFGLGEGLPGRIWQTREPQLWQAVGERPEFVRRDAARQAGLDTIYGLPLESREELIGVLVVGSRQQRADLQQFAPLLPEFGRQFGGELRRKQLEQELAQIFELVPDILCVTDQAGTFHKVNPAMCQMFEYSEAELLGKGLSGLIHPDDTARMLQALANLTDAQDSHVSESRYLSASGKVRWLSWTSVFAADEGLVFSAARDITPTRMLLTIGELNRCLVQEADWLQALAKTLPLIGEAAHVDRVYFFQTHQDSTERVHASQKLEWNRGVAPAQLANPALQNIDMADFADFMAPLGAGQPFQAVVSELPAGKTQEVLVAQDIQSILVLPIFAQGRLYGYLGFDDCSTPRNWRLDEVSFLQSLSVNLSSAIESRENALAIEQAYTEKNTILESIGDAFFAMDRAWNITYCNHMAERLLQTQRDEVMGRNAWEVFPDAVELPFRAYYQQALDSNQPVHFEAYFPPVASWFELSAYPSAAGLSIYFKDIGERKATEAQLNSLNQELQQHVKALATSNQDLEQFAYVASHDLQEPLRMVTSFLDRLEHKYAEVLDERGKRYIFFAVDGARRMRQIILDLLEFSRVGKDQEHPERLDLNLLLGDVVALLRAKIDEAGARVTWADMPVVIGFQVPLRQLFQNLIDNALKYRDPARPPEIQIAAQELQHHWEFSVTDNGIGIEAEYFERIFVIFQRLHTREDYAGTGMGLAICKKIVDSLGGTIGLSSEKGVGTCFRFSIRKEGESSRETDPHSAG